MSISFNHPKDTMTSTSTLNLIVIGGTPTTPRPIRLSASSVIMPVRALPTGEAGAMVFDTATKTMKYHDGLNWVELQSADEILGPINSQITNIYQTLGSKVDTVTYMSGSVPQASISGTQLNITFPLVSGGGGTGQNGLFTSSKQGSIQYYALTSGMNAATIREQMSGVANGQSGRNGTQASPWVTNDGWCFSDGMWWTWIGDAGTVTMQVPNLNQQAYLKPMSTNGATQIGSVVVASGSVTSTALTIAQLPPLTFTVQGQTNESGLHTHTQKTLGNDRPGANALTSSDARWAGYTLDNIQSSGNHIHTFTGTTNTLGSGQAHGHDIQNVDVAHFNVATVYNIATPSYALNESAANGKYVLKSGDVMTGSLTIANGVTLTGNDTNLAMYFRNSSNGERAAVYHNTTTNTLRLRSAGGTEVSISADGSLYALNMNAGNNITSFSNTVTSATSTVNGKNVVRSVNGYNADATGNVVIPTSLSGVRLGSAVQLGQGGWRGNYGGNYPGYVMTAYESYSSSRHLSVEIRPVQIQVDGIWYNVTQI